MSDVVKQYDINIHMVDGENSSNNAPTAIPKPHTGGDLGGINPLSTAQQVFARMPYGGEISKGVGTINSVYGTADKMMNGNASGLSIALMALSAAKAAHNFASSYVKDLRQSGELQRRAGIYRRDAK